MAAGLLLIGAAAIGAAWVFSRRVVWSDARPGLAPLSVYGDWIAVPAEAQFGGRHNLPGGGSGARPTADAQDTIALHVGEGSTR